MATPVLMAKDLLDQYKKANQNGRIAIMEKAAADLTGNQMKILKKEVKKIEEEERAEADDNPVEFGDVEGGDDEEDDADSGIGASVKTKPAAGHVSGNGGGGGGGGTKTSGDGKAPTAKPVTDKELNAFWDDLERYSGDNLLDAQVLADFQYVGFDANEIMRSIIQAGTAAKRKRDVILSDIAKMCTIAVVKGSITDRNLKKMSDAGKKTYSELEALYNLKKGGSKGVDPKVVTIARVGAAFPGSIMKILMKRPDLAKKFAGPFGTKILPPYLRHQSAAACIPDSLSDDVKTFLLGLITAYTSDQSKVISKSKDSPSDIFDNQENFVTSTNSSSYPSEQVRKSLFQTWTLVADFEKLQTVAAQIVKVNKSFEIISKETLQTAISAL